MMLLYFYGIIAWMDRIMRIFLRSKGFVFHLSVTEAQEQRTFREQIP